MLVREILDKSTTNNCVCTGMLCTTSEAKSIAGGTQSLKVAGRRAEASKPSVVDRGNEIHSVGILRIRLIRLLPRIRLTILGHSF